MVKQTLKAGLSIFVLSAVLVWCGFEEKDMVAATEKMDNGSCEGVCYQPYLDAEEYYIGKLNPEKYDDWAKKHDQGSIYNSKLRNEKLSSHFEKNKND